jgi:hypothetical protein
MRRYVLAVALLVAGAAMPAYADHDRFLTISGDGTGYVDLRLDSEVTLDPTFAKFSTSGRVAGYYVRRAGSPWDAPYAFGASVRDVGVNGGSSKLAPGAYRVYLVADGRASVRILARGLHRNVTARVAHRGALTVDVARVDPGPDVVPARYRGSHGTRLRGGNTFVLAMSKAVVTGAPGWGEIKSCLGAAQAGSACESATDGLEPRGRITGKGTYTASRTFRPTEVPGPTTLHQRYAGTADADVVTATLELSL